METDAPWRALEATTETRVADVRGPSRMSTVLLILGAAVLVAASLGAVAFVELRPSGQVEVVSGGSPAAAASRAAASQAMVVVQVAGAVLKPGVYSLPAGSRVGDAIKAAGGYSKDVDPRAAETQLNLAAKLTDAQSIVVPRRGEATATPGKSGATKSAAPSGPAGPVNLNTATADQLDALPGIGPVTAAKIIASREQMPFASINDLVSRKVVSASTFAKFKNQVTV